MKNYAKQMRTYSLIALVSVLLAAFYMLYNLRFDPEYYIYTGAAGMVAFAALWGGSVAGLVASIFAIFIYAITYFYSAIRYGIYFDISYTQGLWLFFYLAAALVMGKIGDGVNFYSGLHQKYPQEIDDLVQDFAFNLVSQRKFNKFVDSEIARARRMQGRFILAEIAVLDIGEITRVFGGKGIYKVTEKVKLYLRAMVKETDKVSKLNNTTFEVLFAELSREEAATRIAHLKKQLENSYLEYKGTVIKFSVRIQAGLALFPQDGEDIYQLRDKAGKGLAGAE